MNYDKEISISEIDNDFVQALFFEVNGYLNILSYISTKQDVLPEHLNYYTELYIKNNAALEMTKAEMVAKYLPDTQVSQYLFDFDHQKLLYTERA